MLKALLKEIEDNPGLIHTGALSKKLGVEEGALLGMIDYLVRKGKLRDDEVAARDLLDFNTTCASGGCGSCPGIEHCPFIIKTPKTYSLRVKGTGGQDNRRH